jgi:hypothetical protein
MLRKLAAHPTSGHGTGLAGDAVTLAEYAGASYLFGYVQNAYPGRARLFGFPADLAAGVGLKALSLVSTLAGVAKGARSHLDTVGNAGIGAYFHTLGSGHGFKKSGRVRAILPAGAAAKLQAAVPESTIFGVAARAPQGDLLTSADLARLAQR